MHSYRYLIIGGGMTADAAVRGIRQIDGQGTVGLISREAHPPYSRPPLSKGLWLGKSRDRIWRSTESLGVTLHLGRTAVALDPAIKHVTDDRGTVYRFERLLLATGGSARRLAFGGDEIIYFRTLDDYLRLWALADKGQRFVVIGGGFIGSEIAAVLTMIGKQVVMVFPEEGICSGIFPSDLHQFLNCYFTGKGVEVLAGHRVTGFERRGSAFCLHAQGGETSAERSICADGVVAEIGIQPDTALAEQAGLPVENGIVVDQFLRAGHPDIYAAGDVANFYSEVLAERMRVEHEDNALTMGRIAGRNMAGDSSPYHHLPFYCSDLFDLGYEAVGRLEPGGETLADWSEKYRKGVVYYLRDGRVRGVLLWNVWERVEAARALIAEQGRFAASNLLGRL